MAKERNMSIHERIASEDSAVKINYPKGFKPPKSNKPAAKDNKKKK